MSVEGDRVGGVVSPSNAAVRKCLTWNEASAYTLHDPSLPPFPRTLNPEP